MPFDPNPRDLVWRAARGQPAVGDSHNGAVGGCLSTGTATDREDIDVSDFLC